MVKFSLDMRKSPITVQQWVDTLPNPEPSEAEKQPQPPASTSSNSTPVRNPRLCLLRDCSVQSLQSDDASSCSSVESVLEQRKPDPEEVLIGLGFGPPHDTNVVSRIPERFLRPSKLLPHIDINKFLEQNGLIRESASSSPTSPARFRPKPNN